MKTIFFASRFNNLILTGGSFNWLASFLSGAKNIISPSATYLWHGDIFTQFPLEQISWQRYSPIRYYVLKNHFLIYDSVVHLIRRIKKEIYLAFKFLKGLFR